MLTGCGNNNGSPEKVSEAMLKKLISADFKGTKELFYHEDSYFSENAFAKLAEEKGLLVKDVKKYKVKEKTKEYKDANGKKLVNVTYEVNNTSNFTFKTIEVDNKWYVYDETFYNGNIQVAVPKGSSLTFDGKKLKDKKSEKENVIVKHKGASYGTSIDDVELDVYTIKNALRGEYEVIVTNKGKEVKDKIGTYGKYSASKEGNYTYKTKYEGKVYTITYTIAVPSTNKKATKFIENAYKDIYTAANDKKEFKEVSNYFTTDKNKISGITANYNNLLRRTKNGAYTNYNATLKIIDLYDYGNTVAITGDVTIKYNYKTIKESVAKKEEKKTIIILNKEKNSYVIYGGSNYLPY
jgi:hypothetical protein